MILKPTYSSWQTRGNLDSWIGTCSFNHNPLCVIHHNLSYASPQMQIHNSHQQHWVKPVWQRYPPLLKHIGHISTIMISHIRSDPMQLIPYSMHLSAYTPTSLARKSPWAQRPSNIHTWVINNPEYHQLTITKPQTQGQPQDNSDFDWIFAGRILLPNPRAVLG